MKIVLERGGNRILCSLKENNDKSVCHQSNRDVFYICSKLECGHSRKITDLAFLEGKYITTAFHDSFRQRIQLGMDGVVVVLIKP